MNGLAGILVGLAAVLISSGTLVISVLMSRRRDNISENTAREHLLHQSERERHRLAEENLMLMRKLLNMSTQLPDDDDVGAHGKFR